jgi:ABC-type glycerol-3-phosphate transport system substrate-binding protein
VPGQQRPQPTLRHPWQLLLSGSLMLLLIAGATSLMSCTSLAQAVEGLGRRPGTRTSVVQPTSSATTVVRTPTDVPRQETATPVGAQVPLTLTLWLPPEMADSARRQGQALYVLNRAFTAANPSLSVEVYPKAPYGQGGLVNLLVATRPVVPTRLPDLVVIDLSEIRKLDGTDMLLPLDGVLPQGLWDDLFAVAAAAATVDGQKVAMPFQTDVVFMAYDGGSAQTPPRTWEQLLSSNKLRYVFPAGEGDGSAADTFVLHYLAEGGDLGQPPGRPTIDATTAARVLRSYKNAIDAGVVPSNVRDYRDNADCWAALASGEATLADVSSWSYQRDRTSIPQLRYAQIPTTRGDTVTLARSWAWAIIARDPGHQEAAARYIISALRPEYLVTWSTTSFHLPTHRSILARSIDDEAYQAFLADLLDHARPYPSVRDYPEVQAAIMRAIEDVLGGVATPERAAAAAAAAVARLR